jgi:hypothetical protein
MDASTEDAELRLPAVARQSAKETYEDPTRPSASY